MIYNAALITRPLADIPAQPVTWLWHNRIPLGKLTTIAGDPGLGKTLLTHAIAATVSRGGRFSDSAPCELGDVLLLSAEDDPGDTIRPRLEGMGADLERVHFANKYEFTDGDGTLYTNTFTDVSNWEAIDRTLLEAHAAGRRIRLVVIDPITAYLGDLDGHKNTEIRARLAPLAELAQAWKCAIVLVSHLNKGSGASPIYRVSGSLAFVAAARAVWIVTRDPENDERRLFLPVKANLGPDSGGLAYRINGASGVARVEWESGTVDVSAADAMRRSSDDERSDLRDAVDFLRQQLADGPLEQKQIERDAIEAGISVPTLRRAKKQAGIVSEKAVGSGKWRWRLPDRQDDHDHPADNHDRLDHVDHLGSRIAPQHDQHHHHDQELRSRA